MNIIIKETLKAAELLILDQNGIDYTQDFIGNAGALINGKFVYDDELDAYLCDQETFDLWEKVVNDHQELNKRINALKAEHGNEAVDGVIENAGNSDLEDEAALINQELDEAFGEQE
jgi:tetrahydromethanopterin S-methyltransferase subunit A